MGTCCFHARSRFLRAKGPFGMTSIKATVRHCSSRALPGLVYHLPRASVSNSIFTWWSLAVCFNSLTMLDGG